MLTDDEILRRLRTIKATSHLDRCARLLPSINQVAAASGVCKQHLYLVINGTAKIGPRSRPKLSKALTGLEKKRKKAIDRPPLAEAEPDSGPYSIDFGTILAVFD
jgi:hypothetical protein